MSAKQIVGIAGAVSACLLFAIRATHPPHFRRSGEQFRSDEWRIIENPTEAILNEPRLVHVSTDAENFWNVIGPLPIANPELLPEHLRGGVAINPHDIIAGLRAELAELKDASGSKEIIDQKDAEIAKLKQQLAGANTLLEKTSKELDVLKVDAARWKQQAEKKKADDKKAAETPKIEPTTAA